MTHEDLATLTTAGGPPGVPTPPMIEYFI